MIQSMAITSNFCLNLCSPIPAPKTTLTQSGTQLISSQIREEKWRRQCVVGMAACMVIGVLQMGNLEDGGNTNSVANAKDMSPLVVAESKPKDPRWSDKRTCPPWHLNSLETIVPENLPRPSARRRWESVSSNVSKNAPAVKVVTVKSRSNCFTM